MCPSCGALETSEEFVGAFCFECWSRREKLFGEIKLPEVRQCSSCKRLQLGGEWLEFSEQTLAEWLSSKLRSKLPVTEAKVTFDKAKNGLTVNARLWFDAGGGKKITRQARFLLRVKQTHCEDCLKRSGGYHEAVIQLRGENKERLRRIAQKMVEKISEKSFVSGFEEKKEGIDLLVGGKRSAMQAVLDTGKHFTVSHKLIGMKEGKRVFRATLCIRI